MYNSHGQFVGPFLIAKLEPYDVEDTLASIKIYVDKLAEIHAQYLVLDTSEQRNISRMNAHNVITGLNDFVDQWHFADGLHMRGIAQYNHWKSHMPYKLHGIFMDLLVKALSQCHGNAEYVNDIMKRQIQDANAKIAHIDPRKAQPGGVEYRADDFLFEAMELYLSGEDVAYIGSFLVAVAFFIQYNPSAGTFLNVASRLEKNP